MISNRNPAPSAELIDARGPRFTATITCVVLAIAILTKSEILVVWQLFQFAIGGFVTPKVAPYGLFYRKVVQPRLPKGSKSEDIRAPKFAQKVGFVFVLIAFIGLFQQILTLFYVFASFALAAAFLNAVFDFCIGCYIYLWFIRTLKK